MDSEPQETESVPQKCMFLRARDCAEDVMAPLVHALPHPNVISGPIRTTSAAIDLLLHNAVGPIAGTIGYAVTSALDWLDGFKARKDNMRTAEGSRLDSNADKLINVSHLLYLMSMYFHSILFDVGAIANIANDLYSMHQRGGIIEQTREGIRASFNPSSCTPIEQSTKQEILRITANVEGKVKMLLQCLAIGSIMLYGDDDTVRTCSSVALLSSACIGFVGTLKRQGIDVLQTLKNIIHRH